MEETLRSIGKTNSSGQIGYYSSEVKDFFNRNKYKNVVCHFAIVGGDNKKSYYRNYVLPKLQEAFFGIGSIYTIEEIDEMMRALIPITILKQFTGDKTIELHRKLDDLTSEETGMLLDLSIQYAAENLNTIIDHEPTETLTKTK